MVLSFSNMNYLFDSSNIDFTIASLLLNESNMNFSSSFNSFDLYSSKLELFSAPWGALIYWDLDFKFWLSNIPFNSLYLSFVISSKEHPLILSSFYVNFL